MKTQALAGTWKKTVLTALAVCLAFVPMLVGFSTATITTSQKQYSVGEGMVVYGTGFTPQVTITLSVERPDKLIDVVPGVTTDTSGAFTANYAPPLIPGRYNFTATDGANTANTATTGAGITGTPGFFINGVPLTGAQPASEFEKIIDSQLAEAESKKPAQ